MENLKKQIQHAVDAFKSGRILEAEDLTSKLIESNPKVVFLYNLQLSKLQTHYIRRTYR